MEAKRRFCLAALLLVAACMLCPGLYADDTTPSASGDAAAVSRPSADKPQLAAATDVQGRTALHLAVAAKQIDAMKALLLAGADARAKDKAGVTPMALAVSTGSEELATQMLLAIADIDLWKASADGDTEAVALVLLGDPDRLHLKPPLGYGSTPLDLAGKHGRVEVVRLLLSAGASFDEHTPLHDAAGEGKLDEMRAWIAAGVDVNANDECWGTALRQAAWRGRTEAVELLLKAGAKIDLADESNYTPLHAACWYGQTKVVTQLIAAGAKLDKPQKCGWRPIHCAVWGGQGDIVRLLLDKGAKVDAFVAAGLGMTDQAVAMSAQPLAKEFGESIGPHPVFWAACCGKVKTLQALLKDPAMLKAVNPRGQTLLHLAATADDAATVKWLIEQGADMEAATADCNWHGEATPLHVAAYEGKLRAAKALLDAGANIEAGTEKSALGGGRAKSGYTPLLVAALAGQKEMAELLLDRGADVEASATDTVSPLCEAASEGKLDICKLLMQRGAKIEGKDIHSTPLHWAAGQGQLEVMEWLIAKGADVNAGLPKGPTPLQRAAEGGGPQAVKLLLENGALADVGEGENAPLWQALRKQDAATVQLLLDAGARVRDDGNDASAIFAGQLGRVDILKKLMSAGLKLTPSGASKYSINDLGCAFAGAIATGRKDMVKFLLANGFDAASALDRSRRTPLELAVRAGSKLVVLMLLEAGADVDGPSERQRTPLVLAAELGRERLVGILLERGAKATGWKSHSPLSAAASAGRCGVLKLLLRHASKDEAGAALFDAVSGDHPEAVKVLAAGGADVDSRDSAGRTPLHLALAAKEPNKELIAALLDAGADVDIPDNDAVCPIHSAIVSGHLDLARMMVAKGADPDIFVASALGMNDRIRALLDKDDTVVRFARGMPGQPLGWAAFCGQTGAMRLLLSRKAQPDGRFSDDVPTPLYWAVANGHVEAARLLLVRGADVSLAKAFGGFTALHSAARFGRAEMTRLLLDHKADPNAKAHSAAWTPLHAAAGNGFDEIVAMLVKAGADVRAPSDKGLTPLEVACSARDAAFSPPYGYKDAPPKRTEAVVAMLLEAMAKKLRAGDERSLNACLHYAAREGKLDLAARALELGADVNAPGQNRRTPLLAAVARCRDVKITRRWDKNQDVETLRAESLAVVRLLLEKGADPGSPEERLSPLWYAREYAGDKEVVDLILTFVASRRPDSR